MGICWFIRPACPYILYKQVPTRMMMGGSVASLGCMLRY
jgi:hypothetical protein